MDAGRAGRPRIQYQRWNVISLAYRSMEESGLLGAEERNVLGGKIRKYYRSTDKGREVLDEARKKAYELFKEIQE